MGTLINLKAINPARLALSKQRHCQRLAVAELDRLLPFLANDAGTLEVEFRVFRHESNELLLELTLSSELFLQCDRCLEVFTFPWSSHSTLVINSEDDYLSDDKDRLPYERVCMDHTGRLNLLDVIIDELILGLPRKHLEPCLNLANEYSGADEHLDKAN